jgi:protocatechuate 3,4-dioxygenase beta subunit
MLLPRRSWLRWCLLGSVLPGLATSSACGQQPPVEYPKFTPAPSEEPAQVLELIDQARAILRSGRTVTDVLTTSTFLPVRSYPRFRTLIRDSAPVGSVSMVPSSEPGELLQVRGTVLDAQGRPVKGALIYAYHTSAKGWYSDKAAHFSGDSADFKYARLFAYLKTDEEGRYRLKTIRPAGYPATDLPAHIHVHVDAAGSQSFATEIRFDDDPRLTAKWRERSKQEGCIICPVKKEADKTQQVVADFRLR